MAKLEGVSVVRVLATIRGGRGRRVERERVEAAGAGLRVVEAESRLAAIDAEIEVLAARRRLLDDAPQTFARLLDETERAMVAAGDDGVARLRAERIQVAADLKNTREAVRAAHRALSSIDAVLETLSGLASPWWPSSAGRRGRFAVAGRLAATAEGRLAVLNRKLSDVSGTSSVPAVLGVGPAGGRMDYWITTPFSDLALRDKIEKSQASVAEVWRTVVAVHEWLASRVGAGRARLVELDATRRSVALGEP